MPDSNLERPTSLSRRKANQYFYFKVLFNLFLIVLGAFLITFFLRRVQTRTALARQERNSYLALEEAVELLRENELDATALSQIYHRGNQEVLSDLSQILSKVLLDPSDEDGKKACAKIFADAAERAGAEYLFLISQDSMIVFAPDVSLFGVNPAASAMLTQDNINRIMRGTVREDGTILPVTVRNQFGTYYFYASPYRHNGVLCTLMLGVDASVLDQQTSSLKDASVVLSRSSLSNDGFLFAVDKMDNTFLYYKNGTDILTGQSAIRDGVSTAALNDGYTGTETILGVPYLCVSKSYGTRTILCAAAREDQVLSADSNVLFWSVLGFILVMFLCLFYSVAVRNHFVRYAVKTDRVSLGSLRGNTFYFDKSIFRKVFPLMLIGVLVIFCISFYAQTLLEITEGIEQSDVALEEVRGKYEESVLNREIIRDYYNELFLSKARLIAFMIEEDPSVLNEDTDHYYTVFDETGIRHYINDDEGNPLRSVASSSALQKMCDSNEVDAIRVFDEDGRTIATNKTDWYLTISHEEEDPLHEFLTIPDGRADALSLDSAAEDPEDASQLIGTVFHYYTALDQYGKTVYVSRSACENAGKSGEDGQEGLGEATAHRSLLWLRLKSDLARKLIETTDISRVLSTYALNDGFIVMFDNETDHNCLYSPNKASIGKTAAELGISPNAFNVGDYYGFSSVNAIEYFLCCRYMEGYYVSTALPVSTMFVSRLPVAASTALCSFLLILILLMTVTITSHDEEVLYESLSEEQAEKGLNSAIFNLVLPSGRSASTVKAAARWDNRRIPWDEKSPEQKLGFTVALTLGLLMIYLLVWVIGADSFFDEKSVVHYILSFTWDKGLNIFAFSACVLVLVVVNLLVLLFRVPVWLSAELFGARGETIGHLLLSTVKYGGVIGAFFYCLFLLGIDSSNLLASAGILSLIIGLGAQTLIMDILAGIFIIFEGEFRVGDIVTIDGYRGTVMDIGLRTTKILGPDGNIKIFNNSSISGVLNMTQEASLAVCTISIEYGQDLDYVEAVLKRELPLLHENNNMILDDPRYMGVQNLGESGVDLRIICHCHEEDIKMVNRYLNREVLKIFYRNRINVPFPNITLSPLSTDNRPTVDDLPGEEKAETTGSMSKE